MIHEGVSLHYFPSFSSINFFSNITQPVHHINKCMTNNNNDQCQDVKLTQVLQFVFLPKLKIVRFKSVSAPVLRPWHQASAHDSYTKQLQNFMNTKLFGDRQKV